MLELLWRPDSFSRKNQFLAFIKYWKLITVFTKALHWIILWAIRDQSTPSNRAYLKLILILLRFEVFTVVLQFDLVLPSSVLPRGNLTRIRLAFQVFPNPPGIIPSIFCFHLISLIRSCALSQHVLFSFLCGCYNSLVPILRFSSAISWYPLQLNAATWR